MNNLGHIGLSKADVSRWFEAKVMSFDGSYQAKVNAINTFNYRLKNEKSQGHYRERIDAIRRASSPEDLLNKVYGKVGGKVAKEALSVLQEKGVLKADMSERERFNFYFNTREEFYYENQELIEEFNKARAEGRNDVDELGEMLKEAY